MSLTVTANDISLKALITLGVYQAGQALSAFDAQFCFGLITELVDSWNIQALTVLTQDRDVYNLVSGQGGPDNPYTIGPGGDFDTGASARPTVIRSANLLLNTTSPYPTEIPLAVITDDMSAANPIKALQGGYPSTLFYQASVPLGSIQLWNVPNTAINQIVLYTDHLTPTFTSQNVVYVCPPGYAKAFRLCVAAAIADGYSVPMPARAKAQQDADEALRWVKMGNAPMQDLAVDAAYINDAHSSYVIQTDQGA